MPFCAVPYNASSTKYLGRQFGEFGAEHLSHRLDTKVHAAIKPAEEQLIQALLA